MKPFVAKFGISNLPNASRSPEVKYDIERESVMLVGSSTLAIESREDLRENTGSFCTRAQADPTSDEASDR